MIRVIIKSSFFVALLIVGSGLYAKNQSEIVSDPEGLYFFENAEVKEAYYEGYPLALGIVLSFESRWPNKVEEKLIMEALQKEGLKKTYTAESPLRWWVFSWPYVRLRKDALSVCGELPQNISRLLEYCYYDSMP